MEQMNVPEIMKVVVDLTHANIPASVRTFRPLLFRDGNVYCCILGPDLKKGVFGCGNSPQEAFLDWDRSFHLRLKNTDEDDEVGRYIHDTLRTSVNKVW